MRFFKNNHFPSLFQSHSSSAAADGESELCLTTHGLRWPRIRGLRLTQTFFLHHLAEMAKLVQMAHDQAGLHSSHSVYYLYYGGGVKSMSLQSCCPVKTHGDVILSSVFCFLTIINKHFPFLSDFVPLYCVSPRVRETWESYFFLRKDLTSPETKPS